MSQPYNSIAVSDHEEAMVAFFTALLVGDAEGIPLTDATARMATPNGESATGTTAARSAAAAIRAAATIDSNTQDATPNNDIAARTTTLPQRPFQRFRWWLSRNNRHWDTPSLPFAERRNASSNLSNSTNDVYNYNDVNGITATASSLFRESDSNGHERSTSNNDTYTSNNDNNTSRPTDDGTTTRNTSLYEPFPNDDDERRLDDALRLLDDVLRRQDDDVRRQDKLLCPLCKKEHLPVENTTGISLENEEENDMDNDINNEHENNEGSSPEEGTVLPLRTTGTFGQNFLSEREHSSNLLQRRATLERYGDGWICRDYPSVGGTLNGLGHNGGYVDEYEALQLARRRATTGVFEAIGRDEENSRDTFNFIASVGEEDSLVLHRRRSQGGLTANWQSMEGSEMEIEDDDDDCSEITVDATIEIGSNNPTVVSGNERNQQVNGESTRLGSPVGVGSVELSPLENNDEIDGDSAVSSAPSLRPTEIISTSRDSSRSNSDYEQEGHENFTLSDVPFEESMARNRIRTVRSHSSNNSRGNNSEPSSDGFIPSHFQRQYSSASPDSTHSPNRSRTRSLPLDPPILAVGRSLEERYSELSNSRFFTRPQVRTGPEFRNSQGSTIRVKKLRDYGAMKVFVSAKCPICLEDCETVVSLKCGHCLCEEDYRNLGGYLASEKDKLLAKAAANAKYQQH